MVKHMVFSTCALSDFRPYVVMKLGWYWGDASSRKTFLAACNLAKLSAWGQHFPWEASAWGWFFGESTVKKCSAFQRRRLRKEHSVLPMVRDSSDLFPWRALAVAFGWSPEICQQCGPCVDDMPFPESLWKPAHIGSSKSLWKTSWPTLGQFVVIASPRSPHPLIMLQPPTASTADRPCQQLSLLQPKVTETKGLNICSKQEWGQALEQNGLSHAPSDPLSCWYPDRVEEEAVWAAGILIFSDNKKNPPIFRHQKVTQNWVPPEGKVEEEGVGKYVD